VVKEMLLLRINDCQPSPSRGIGYDKRTQL